MTWFYRRPEMSSHHSGCSGRKGARRSCVNRRAAAGSGFEWVRWYWRTLVAAGGGEGGRLGVGVGVATINDGIFRWVRAPTGGRRPQPAR